MSTGHVSSTELSAGESIKNTGIYSWVDGSGDAHGGWAGGHVVGAPMLFPWRGKDEAPGVGRGQWLKACDNAKSPASSSGRLTR